MTLVSTSVGREINEIAECLARPDAQWELANVITYMWRGAALFLISSPSCSSKQPQKAITIGYQPKAILGKVFYGPS